MVALIKELVAFIIQNKKWWLIPMFTVLLLVGLLLVVGAGSAVGPFIYALF